MLWGIPIATATHAKVEAASIDSVQFMVRDFALH